MADRYRLTRIAFDVVSVFGSLRASGVPGPVIVRILADHGYSASSVHNQLTRMVQRGIILAERSGRLTVYRLSEAILGQFLDIGGERVTPDFAGHFDAAIYTIPETARQLRDRFQYMARMLGYRQLRPGVFIGFSDQSQALAAQLPDLEDGAWFECTRIVPADVTAAKRMTAIAFELSDAHRQVEELEAACRVLGREGQAPGTASPDLPIGKFFDIYYRVARAVMENPILPEELVGPDQSAMRLRDLMDRCNIEYFVRYNRQVHEAIEDTAAYALIEWLPEDSEAGRRSA